jgi:hypothetical protein
VRGKLLNDTQISPIPLSSKAIVSSLNGNTSKHHSLENDRPPVNSRRRIRCLFFDRSDSR